MTQNSHWVFGIHAVDALLKRRPQSIEEAFIQAERHDQRLQALIELLEQHNLRYQRIPRAELDQLVSGSHQGVVVRTLAGQSLREQDLWQQLDQLTHDPLLLVLDGVTDPHNLGACLRTADAAGADAVIVPKDKSAGLNATVRKVACGAAEVVPFYQVTNLARTLRELQQRGIWVVGTAGEAEQSLYQLSLSGGLALIMGNEGKGMRRLTREHCDYLAKLPMAGSVSSLNVSVATGVCLFEIVRQRLALSQAAGNAG